MSGHEPVPWRAAYRLQLRPGFDFAAAIEVLDHLDALGVSHVYCSPILEAGPASDHGYDVVAHDRVRAALGGEDGFRALVDAARHRGMGIVVDVVPNHMAIGGTGGGNDWWWDVLEHGPESPHAGSFDIDWGASPDGRVLVPILGDHYRRILERGELAVHRAHGRGFEVTYHEHRLPLRPVSLAPVLRAAATRGGDPVLAIVADRLEALRSGEADRSDVETAMAALAAHVEDRPAAAGDLDGVLAEVSDDRSRLDGLLRDQWWRLARWQLANPEIAYRRFFDVTELVALRTDLPPVFDRTHELVLDLVGDGSIDGLRIDHPDGLRDPEAYLTELAARAPGTLVWVEKILGPAEELPRSWPVAGTTGYDFLDLASRLLLHGPGMERLADLFAASAGVARDFHAEARAGKRFVLAALLGADVDRVTDLAARCCREAGWDVARTDLRAAVVELVTWIPVYRTYVRPGRATDARDVELLDGALDATLASRPALDPDSTRGVVAMLRRPGTTAEVELAARFQQLCASAAAKGIEDTALYRWAPVAARCEVGCEPATPAVDGAGFHAEVARVAQRWPRRLLDTSTHDTKRSEDVRARLLAISEAPDEWWAAAERLRDLARERAGVAPGDAGLEHLLVQSAVGAWPIAAERLADYAVKAAREAKRTTSWLEPDEEAEGRLRRWAVTLADDPEVRVAVEAALAPLLGAGRSNGLAQVVLKLTCPGVPVLYQGTELWDHHLVDPDNRRPVDYDLRRSIVCDDRPGTPVELDPTGPGAAKARVIRRVLDLRRRRPDDLDPAAPHTPLDARGAAARHAVAFQRGEGVVSVVMRLPRLLDEGGGWQDTALELPAGSWTDVLTGTTWRGAVGLRDLLAALPVAVLESAAEGSPGGSA